MIGSISGYSPRSRPRSLASTSMVPLLPVMVHDCRADSTSGPTWPNNGCLDNGMRGQPLTTRCQKGGYPGLPTTAAQDPTHLLLLKLGTYFVADRGRVPLPAARRTDPARSGP